MTLDQAARFALRDATSAWHDRVDAAFSSVVLTDRVGYGRFLQAQAAAHLPVEDALDVAGVEAIVPDWRARRRAEAIRADLAALDLAVPVLEAPPVLPGAAAMLGAAYVLEGSRLGGAMLRRSVPDAFPRAFLSGGSSAAWRDLISILDAVLGNGKEIDAAITAACDVFMLFERSGRRLLEDAPTLGR